MSAETISTRQLARLLHVRPSELRAAAARLGMVAGVEVTHAGAGEPTVRRLWPQDWAAELRGELGQRAELDIGALCSGSPDEGQTG